MTGVLDVSKGDLVGLVIGPGGPGATAAVATGTATARVTLDEIVTMEAELGPRWVVWSQATTGALARLGHGKFENVRIGKRFELTVEGPVTDEIKAEVRELAEQVLSNSVIEDVVAIDFGDSAANGEAGA